MTIIESSTSSYFKTLKMYTANVFVFFVIILVSASVADEDNCPEKSGLASIKLKRNLLCGYDKTLRPVKDHKTPVKVIVRMIVKYLMFEALSNSFTVDSWLALYWKDEHLKWKPEDYESISSIHFSSYEIWLPDLSVYNRNDQSGSPAAISDANCAISSNGQVVCVPPSRQTSLCVGDLTRFPFDTQNCSIRFGSWVHSGEEIDLKLASPAIGTEDLVPNDEWGLISTNAVKHPGKFKCCPNNTYPSLYFSFEIKRMAGGHAASIILPAITLIILTLTSLWIDPTHHDRITLCCTNILCGFLYVQYISWTVPRTGNNTPLILLFGRDSLFLASFTLIFTIILKNMVNNKGPAPVWISVLVSSILSCKPGQFIFLTDSSLKGIATAKGEDDGSSIINNTEDNSASKPTHDYQIFAIMLDRVCFISYCIVFLCMLMAFTP